MSKFPLRGCRSTVWRAMSDRARFYCTCPEIRWPVLLVARSRTRDFPLCSKVFNGLFYLSTGMPCRAFVPFKGASSCDVFLLTIVEELNCWKLKLNCWDPNFEMRKIFGKWKTKFLKNLGEKIKYWDYNSMFYNLYVCTYMFVVRFKREKDY